MFVCKEEELIVVWMVFESIDKVVVIIEGWFNDGQFDLIIWVVMLMESVVVDVGGVGFQIFI